MDKTEALSRLTFCEDCAFWHRGVHTDMGYVDWEGACDRPYEDPVCRAYDDFCSKGVKKNG